MELQTPIPFKSRMKPRERQKCAIFPSLIWSGEGGGGGSRFSIYFVQACSQAYDCQTSDTSANHLSGRPLWHILVKQTDGAKISTREIRLLNIREINYTRKLVRISRETTNIGQDASATIKMLSYFISVVLQLQQGP